MGVLACGRNPAGSVDIRQGVTCGRGENDEEFQRGSRLASAAVLGALAFWLMFPGTYGLAVLLLALIIGLLLVDRRSRHGAS